MTIVTRADGFDPACLEGAVSRAAGGKGFSGTVRVTRHGEPVFTRAFGMASRRWSIPNTCDTRFRVASVSKMFTAVAVLQLIERKQVRLDKALVDFVRDHMPQLDPRVTVRHALTMTAGIGDWFEEGSDDWQAEWAVLTSSHPLYLLRGNKDYLPLFANKQPHFPPGERHLYNGAGHLRWGHTGEEDGVSARFYHYPQQDLDVAVLGNISWCAGDMGWAIHDAVVGN
ncbi:serine hydrolase domain-containing protein [Streptomyces melanosporofaciens]|uniref:Beta-lactamase n=1 Tax=Streptomyces melanosporofaciens TaxID=67327 RepID=A0A1H4I858_STRMJ|nr:serine hydrolase domain-containing protein [Streptomyces melanosporofaciens]SEB30090.1 Beta-lactamase [Streptomyces melanosporofaciens]